MSGAAGKRHQSGKNTARHTLMSSLEEDLNKEDIIKQEEMAAAVDTDAKIDLLVTAIENVNGRFMKVHEMINNASDGLDPRTTDCKERILSLTEENKQLRFELDMLHGFFIKSEKENQTLRDKVTALSAHNMKDNLIIHGLCADESTETPIETVIEFLKEKMSLEFQHTEVIYARRIGKAVKVTDPRPMLLHAKPALHELIMSNLRNLKDKKNVKKRYYKIVKQLPDQWMEEKRQLNVQIAQARKINNDKDEMQEKDEIKIVNRTLYVNRVPQKKITLNAPTAKDIFVDKVEQEKMEKVKFVSSTTVEEQGSVFTAYALRLQSMIEVKRAYNRLKQLNPSASHIVAASSFKNCECYQDDREFGAVHRLLRVITENSYTNVAVFVVIFHDGPNIGPRQHQIYSQVTMEVLARTKTK